MITIRELRARLAGQALQGILSGCGTHWRDGSARAAITPRDAAVFSLEYADALLTRLGFELPAPERSEPPPVCVCTGTLPQSSCRGP